MMGLPCCVLTHSPVKDRASTSQVYYSGQVLPEIQEGHGVCSGYPQSVYVGTGPLRGRYPHLWQQEDLGPVFSRAAPGESWLDEDHTQQHALDCGLRNWVDGGAHP